MIWVLPSLVVCCAVWVAYCWGRTEGARESYCRGCGEGDCVCPQVCAECGGSGVLVREGDQEFPCWACQEVF